MTTTPPPRSRRRVAGTDPGPADRLRLLGQAERRAVMIRFPWRYRLAAWALLVILPAMVWPHDHAAVIAWAMMLLCIDGFCLAQAARWRRRAAEHRRALF